MTTSELHKQLYAMVETLKNAEKTRNYLADVVSETELKIEELNDFIEHKTEALFAFASANGEDAEQFLRAK